MSGQRKEQKNGHEQPFDLKYLGIGNENFQAKYFDNLDIIKQAVEDYAKPITRSET